MNNYNDNFCKALDWAENNKMDNSPLGAIALAGFLTLEMLNELNFKLEKKPNNYKGLVDLYEKLITKHEHSTNQMVILTITFLNVGMDVLFEINKKIDTKKNDSDGLLERVNSWVSEDGVYPSLFKKVTDVLNLFNQKINENIVNPTEIKEKLRKKYRQIL